MMFNDSTEIHDNSSSEAVVEASQFCLSRAVATQLLDKLCHDDAFRAMFTADARTALASIGDVSAADARINAGPWICMHGDALPSKLEMQELRDSLLDQMIAPMSQDIFHFPTTK